MSKESKIKIGDYIEEYDNSGNLIEKGKVLDFSPSGIIAYVMTKRGLADCQVKRCFKKQ